MGWLGLKKALKKGTALKSEFQKSDKKDPFKQSPQQVPFEAEKKRQETKRMWDLIDKYHRKERLKGEQSAEKEVQEKNPKLNKAPVRSPRKGHTIAQLERLKQDHWHNPDTGTEIAEEEGQEYLNQLYQNRADRETEKMIREYSRPPKKIAKASAHEIWDLEYPIDAGLEKVEWNEPDLSEHHGKDVFVYYNLHKKVWSIKDRKTGIVIAHSKKVSVDNPQFKVSEAGRQRVLRDKSKNVHAGVVGKLNAHNNDFSSEGKKRVSYNPYKYSHFYESDTQAPVHSAESAILHVQDKIDNDGKAVRIPHVHAKTPVSNAPIVNEKIKKTKSLKKAVSMDELRSQGYKFNILKPTARRQAYAVTVHHKGKRVGHVLYSTSARLGSRKENEHQKGFHEVYRAEVNEGHRGKGLYQHMLNIGAEHVKSMGGKGLMSEGFQRSPDATRAWDKAGSFAVSPKDNTSIKPLPYSADYFIQKSKDGFNPSKKIKKGVARRLFPFDPQKVPTTERADVNEWQTYGAEPAPDIDDPDIDYYRDPGTIRDEIDPISPHAKQRALLRLTSRTRVRKNPATNEREFLLHRGVLGHEHDYVTEGDNYRYSHQRSSWTPDWEKANRFTKIMGHDFNENMERTKEESRPGQVISAWIPESKIAHVPYMYGGISGPHSRGENDYKKEHEIIVEPHEGRIVPHMEAFPPQAATRADRIASLSRKAKEKYRAKQEIQARMKQPLRPKFPKKPKKADPNQLELPLAASEPYLTLLELKKKEGLYKSLQKVASSSAAPAVKLNPEHGKIIANAYENMKHDPNHPEVKAAYGALIDETKKQFKDMLTQGFRFSAIKQGQDNPYKTSKDLHADIEKNKHLHFFPTEQGFGAEGSAPKDHPMLQPTEFVHEGKPLLANDLFRIVHDYRGHHLGGKSGFGPKGEQQAYLTHKKDFSPLAQKALASETLGQNSWVNFGPHGEQNRKNPEKTVYAEQKAGLLPDNIVSGKWHE